MTIISIADGGWRMADFKKTTRSLPSAIRHPPSVIGSLAIILCLSAFFLMFPSQNRAFGDEVDRLLVAVNGKVITQGDLWLARNLSALFSLGKKNGAVSREQEINRLVELELLYQELGNFPAIQAEESQVELRLEDLARVYAELGGLPGVSRRLGLQETELRSHVALQISVMKFIDFRFRPFATVTREETKAYYEEKLLPQLQKSARVRVPELSEVSSEIEKILVQQKIDQAMEQWMQEIKRHSRIEYYTRAELPPGGPGR